MKVSRARVQWQARAINALSKSASETVAAKIRETGERDAIVETVVEMASAYSDMSAGITAKYYNDIRNASNLTPGRKKLPKYEATSASGFYPGRTRAAAWSILEEVEAGKNTVPLDKLLGDLVGRCIKNAADTCVRENVRRDPSKPKYAIVPNGDACAFCQMRASLGYMYATEDAVESHDHCTCVATPVFRDSDIQGYNPKEYEDRWKDAVAEYDRLMDGDFDDAQSQYLYDRIDRARQNAIDEGRDFDRTNAVLIVMREQQGIK